MSSAETASRYAPVFAQKVMDEWRVADQIAPLDLAAPGDLSRMRENPEPLHATRVSPPSAEVEVVSAVSSA